MRRSSNQKPSFFKVLSNMDFTKLLRVAPAFFRRYGLTPPENAKLRVAHSARAWRVKVERLENGLFCFTKGWRSFAKDAGLQLGEFLVLSLVREWEFHVAIYDTSFCGREIPYKTTQLNAHGTTCSSSRESDPLYFEIYLKDHHRSRVTLRKKFLDTAGVRGKKCVMMKYEGKRSCTSVVLDVQGRWSRVDLATGWHEFRNANGLDIGKTYSFRFDPDDNVIHVNQVIKNMNQGRFRFN